ncbi:hypothetical protein F4775DRAFT_595964 [Biscogniauxia sp. FL1348]|nr:hypothetical protein F4775DRAFT_595964 [Biscogniauxia sp. FL1348]
MSDYTLAIMSALTATKLNGNGKRLAPPSSSAPSPSPSIKSGDVSSKRQKRDKDFTLDDASSTPAAAAARAAANDFGKHMLTQLVYAVEFLKSKGTTKSLQEILDHLTLNQLDERQLKTFVETLIKHPQVTYTPVSQAKAAASKLPAWRLGEYQFRAKIPGVKDKVTLLESLQKKTDASCIVVRDLKDGWPECDKAITELEDERKILVVRTKKDNHAKYVWPNDPSLSHRIDPEFQAMWHKVELPSVDDIVRKLQAVGQKPASEDPRLKKIDAPKTGPKKRKAARPPKNQSNAHMAHLLKDFSHLKR